MYKVLTMIFSFSILVMSIGGIILGIRYYQEKAIKVMQLVEVEEELLVLEDKEGMLLSGEGNSEAESDINEDIVSGVRNNESFFEHIEKNSDKGNSAVEDNSGSEEDDDEVNDTDIEEVNPYFIKINKEMNTVTIYGLDEDGEYSVPVKAMVCSAGRATPLGTFRTSDKYTWRLLNGNVWGQYSTRITKNILFHSVPNSRKAKDSLISKYYNKLGTTASAGCVRLTVEDAKWIIDNCPSGTSVEIYNDSDPGPLGKPIPITVPGGTKWDPTDPDPNNPWLEKTAEIIGVKDQSIKLYDGVNPLDGISAMDRFGNDITRGIVVSGGIDTTTPGTYEITYKVTDSMGSTVLETATFTVVED